MAIGSVSGKVKQVNEDFTLAMELGEVQVMVLADGCGGVPLGATASELAAEAAAAELLWGIRLGSPDPDQVKLIEAAFRAAARRLNSEGTKLGIDPLTGGLRTTLIAVVANHDYTWGYIGDGGIQVLRSDGNCENILKPQKADRENSNVLAASLGPRVQGHPVFGCTPRRDGDLLLCGTDGVFDRVTGGFAKDVLRMVITTRGDLDSAVAAILHDLSEAKDEGGYVCEDNMSLAVLMNGSAPRLGANFWRN
jgi:serine/threonine protein phosphatase PrpC